MSRTRLDAVRRDLRRAILARRRLLAAIFATLAVITTIQVARPAATTRDVVVAADDLRAGEIVDRADLETVQVDPAAIPDGAVDPQAPPIGRTLAGPVRAGEPLTDVRLVQADLLSGYDPGTVLTTIRLFDPAAGTLVAPGDVVDVLGTDPRGRTGTAVIASGATVVTRAEVDDTALGEGAPLVLAVDHPTALALADASVRQQLTLLIA
ncbi:MAG TPA: SAF domain-containing protein [Nocardioidaceae bacterium]|nr:SAF domain-containing protein [Nocardioidaceae bacterium]